MKEIKLYLKFLYQYASKGFFIGLAIFTTIIGFTLALYTIIFKMTGNLEMSLPITYQLNQFAVIFMMALGIGATGKVFEIAMRIRADRRSFTYALGIMMVIGSIGIGIYHYCMDVVFQTVVRSMIADQGLVGPALSRELGLDGIILLHLCVVAFGVLLGCLGNKLSVAKLVSLIIGSIALVVASIIAAILWNEELTTQIMIGIIESPMILKGLFIIGCIIMSGISALLLRSISFRSYNISQSGVKFGKRSIGNARIRF